MKKNIRFISLVMLLALVICSLPGSMGTAYAAPQTAYKTVYLSMNGYCANGIQFGLSAQGPITVTITYKYLGIWTKNVVLKYNLAPMSLQLKPSYLLMSGQYGNVRIDGNILAARGLGCK